MIASRIVQAALLGAAVIACAAAVLRRRAAWPADKAVPARVADGASFTLVGAVVRPQDYREWVYLTSGLGMSYAPEAQAAAAAAAAAGQGRPPVFDNVFVNRQSYRAFLQSGRWPDGTMFILELRRGERHVSIDTGGQTQGAVLGIEAAVKDTTRYAATGGGRISASAAATGWPSRRRRIPRRPRATPAIATTPRWRTRSFSSIRRCSRSRSGWAP
jgi:hypothetical protein